MRTDINEYLERSEEQLTKGKSTYLPSRFIMQNSINGCDFLNDTDPEIKNQQSFRIKYHITEEGEELTQE